ncbi:MAG: hypothetical protein HYR85_18325 [Planctomycetes bacterium]|nr:hypothetical protein [Planctomycetota bacterium]
MATDQTGSTLLSDVATLEDPEAVRAAAARSRLAPKDGNAATHNALLLLVALTVLGWLAVFLAGLLVNSRPYRESITGGMPGATVLTMGATWVMAFGTYTVTNAAVLTLLAGLAGGLAYRYSSIASAQNAVTATPEPENTLPGAVLRAFFVYIAGLAGVFVMVKDPFGDTSPDQYGRVAGLFSVLAFVLGYDPSGFTKVMQSMLTRIK